MPEETITYEYIRNVQREEQNNSGLSKLPSNFYEKTRVYLDQKRKLLEKKKDRGTSLEINNIESLLENIFNRRETKIINHAIITTRTDIPPQNLIDEEKEFFKEIVDNLKRRRETFLKLLLEKSKEEEFETVKFTEDVEEFVGIDLKKYGPFKKEDEAKIPKENTELLKKTGKVI